MLFNSIAISLELKKYLIVLAIVLLNISCSNDDQSIKLASFDDGNVMLNEYLDHYLLSTQYKPEKLPTEDNLIEIVQQKAFEKMSVLEAMEVKIEKDSFYIDVLNNNERRLLFQKYVQVEITNKLITDSLINKFYAEFSPQYRLKYIMRPFLESSSEQFISSQKDTIEKAYSLLQNGKTFEEVVEKFSQDISTNKKGGDLGWIIRESMGDEALRQVMDTLSEFTYSKPFKGYGGFYIMYKGEKREVEVPPFEEVKQKIWQTLYHSRKIFVEKAAEKRFDELSGKYNYVVINNNIEKIFEKVSPPGEITNSTPLNFGSLLENDKSLKIAQYDSGFVRADDLFADRKKSPTNKFEFFKRFESISQQHLFAKHATELNLQDDTELANQLNDMKTSLLRTILYQRVVKDKVQEELSSYSELKSTELVKKRTEMEKKLREEFENKLKTKYNFTFQTDNFSRALELASIKKEEQNLVRSAAKN